uniref:Uncharacterized protein n=1 Tax=Timema monikensis TaxID=170555 RepID=A0A7R9HSX8_9NEOP|nr:unnamed protein product [Timema monikensis]
MNHFVEKQLTNSQMEEEMGAQKALNNIMTQICLGLRAKRILTLMTDFLSSALSDRAVPEERIAANTFPKDPLKKAASLEHTNVNTIISTQPTNNGIMSQT